MRGAADGARESSGLGASRADGRLQSSATRRAEGERGPALWTSARGQVESRTPTGSSWRSRHEDSRARRSERTARPGRAVSVARIARLARLLRTYSRRPLDPRELAATSD